TISVTDTGTGMSPEVRQRAFEPFFTTKEVGKGTGLGLATVYGIVKQHKGWISVQSTVGEGTVFSIFLPYVKDAKEPSATPPPKPARAGAETILLVEDEAPVRHLTGAVLESLGYKVIEAVSGREAFQLWEQNHSSIDLIFTDMVMPDGMGGRELVQRIQQQKPNAKAIYVSGYSAEFCARDTVLKEGINFLQKPYGPVELSETVRRALDG
ncbi:MAG: response regulator, partial [Limisphaerales bacterium]